MSRTNVHAVVLFRAKVSPNYFEKATWLGFGESSAKLQKGPWGNKKSFIAAPLRTLVRFIPHQRTKHSQHKQQKIIDEIFILLFCSHKQGRLSLCMETVLLCRDSI